MLSFITGLFLKPKLSIGWQFAHWVIQQKNAVKINNWVWKNYGVLNFCVVIRHTVTWPCLAAWESGLSKLRKKQGLKESIDR